ncbi:GntR family transcriptional regulator [Nocardia cyriacigeorgica]|uniref:GntR family transcriptional regulator n=1 Tax=Nocardia cyriacigeorgica TaxID=135487 RepID=A0A5R8P5U5_9NOCA|nr:GntR family transcriptional regulator [Nocardia cyriacigeorgica]TLF96648.1 GntR family transcriptional regulator [Nocardia cyriacigeorgica]
MSETDASLPKYLRIAEDIRGRIERGELGVGDEVESERELAARWSVARPTAAKALNMLRQSGIVESRRGAGTFVARRGPVVRDGNPPAWVRNGPPAWVRGGDPDDSMRGGSEWARGLSRWAGSGGAGAKGSSRLGLVPLEDVPGAEAGDGGERRTPTVIVVAAEVAEPPESVAEVFRSSGEAIVRRVVLGSEGDVRLRTTWYPHEFVSLAPRLLEQAPISGGAGHYLQSVLGKVVAQRHERVCARRVAEGERDHLGIEPDAPVLVRQAVHYDDAGAVLWFAETVYPPDYWVLEPGALADR